MQSCDDTFVRWQSSPSGKPGKFSTSVVVVSCPPAAMPLASQPSKSIGCSSALAAYTAAVCAAGPDPTMQREVFIFPSGPMLLANRVTDAQLGGRNLETPDKDLHPAIKRSMHLMPTALPTTLFLLLHRMPHTREIARVTRDKEEEPASGHVLSHAHWNILGIWTEVYTRFLSYTHTDRALGCSGT